MQTRSLIYGLLGFFIGGLLASVAATTFDKPAAGNTDTTGGSHAMTMDAMTADLKVKSGDEYDKVFIRHMIEHHRSAVDMARLSAQNAKHDEIKKMSESIITAQEKEIAEMRDWQKSWGYETTEADHPTH
jgi:uncharacterized protein (DUF305 family)